MTLDPKSKQRLFELLDGILSQDTSGSVLSKDESSVTVYSASGTANTPEIKTTSDAAEANPNRISITIFNEGDNDLYVRYSSEAASSTVYHKRLEPGEGIGIDNYKGAVTCDGTSMNYVVFELSA